MFQKIEDFFLNKFLGKIIARAAVSAAALAAGPEATALFGKAGLSLSVDPTELAAGMLAAGHGLFEWFKAWRLSKAADAAPKAAEPAK